MNDKLSIKEQIFCNEYIKNDGNGTKAVISAGYAELSASVQQNRLLKKDKIQVELERQNNYNLQATAISKNQLIQHQYELYELARANEEYKTASTILSELTNVLGYKPKEIKQVDHAITFEKLLGMKDITPQATEIAYN
tara:strand:+ start:111 stop:527 length:417 start_codon:yes stop_codon:yes gene_type:complete